MTGLVLLLLGVVPTTDVVEEPVADAFEVNHFFDESGTQLFAQLIVLDWNPRKSRHDVRAYRIIKSADQWPQKDWARGGYTVIWLDGKVWRKLKAKSSQETWTQASVDGDPEVLAREYLEIGKRKELRQPRTTR